MAVNYQQKRNYRNRQANRSNLAYDYNALERERVYERPQPRPQIRTINRPKVSVRPAERVSVAAVLGFAVAGVMLALVLMSYVRLTALSDSVVSLQKELAALETENVTLTASYERTFDLKTLESAAAAAGMSKPSPGQIYYLDMDVPDSASVYVTGNETVVGKLFSSLGKGLYSVVEYFA